jgi:hypothetical protein
MMTALSDCETMPGQLDVDPVQAEAKSRINNNTPNNNRRGG